MHLKKPMRLSFLLVIAFLISSSTKSTTVDSLYKNSIDINISDLFISKYSLSYSKRIKSNMSLDFTLAYRKRSLKERYYNSFSDSWRIYTNYTLKAGFTRYLKYNLFISYVLNYKYNFFDKASFNIKYYGTEKEKMVTKEKSKHQIGPSIQLGLRISEEFITTKLFAGIGMYRSYENEKVFSIYDGIEGLLNYEYPIKKNITQNLPMVIFGFSIGFRK